ncbi:MAG: xanthine dehydrogenase family protein molybdopterin-binding subunit [Acidobacteriota bacterium]|nr:xanthine dehydrogenase family protein molybdopterin-binding subunit [Acidobacteriota bacterium]
MRHEQQAHTMSVGQNVLRQEGREKLTGEAKYVDDITYPGMLYGKTIRSTVAHALIKYINFDPMFDWSRVVIADYRDIPGRNVVVLIEDDQPLLAESKVKHVEEPILLLAAEDREVLEEAAQHIQIEYEPLPAVFSMDDALARKQLLFKQDNIFKRICITKGDVLRGLSKSDRIIEGTYRVGPQEQLYIEPQGMIAIPGEDGAMIIEGSTQCPHYVHRAVKHILDLPDEKVIVRQTVTGGGFGGKEEYPDMLAGHAAVLARKTGRPVKMVYDRVEDLSATTKRHPARIHHRTGVTRDGRLMSMLIDIVMDGGAYCTLSPVVLSRGAIHAAGPYNCDNLRIEAKVVATNHPPYGAFRGFGVPQVCFAIEQHMDQIADSLGIDPLTLRQINMLRQGDRTATGQRLHYSVGSDQVLHAAVARANYHQLVRRYSRQTGTKRRGVGLSFFYHGAGFTGSGELNMRSGAAVELRVDGTASIYTGTTEIGQGTRTIFCQIVAEELGLPYERVFIENPDTSRVPDSGPTVASRTCMIIGGVLQRCASELKQKLVATAAEAIGVSVEAIKIENEHVLCIDAPVMTLADAVTTYVERYGPLRVFQRYDPPPGMQWDEREYRGDAYAAYAFGADVAEVEVDLETFEVKVLRVISAADVGRAIHPILAEGQIEGGTLQAVGYAVMEEVVMQQGRMINNRLTNYLIPTAVDAPEIHAILVESPYPFGPFGAKGIGELPMDGGAPAIASAIYQATGLRVTELPITPERLHQAACQAAGQRPNQEFK